MFIRARDLLMKVCKKELPELPSAEDSIMVFRSILGCQKHNVCSALARYVRIAYTERYNMLQSLLCKDKSK